MKRKLYCVIATLIFLFCITGIFLSKSNNNSNTHPIMKLSQEKKDLLDNSEQRISPNPLSTAKPPPGENHETGHWDGDYWHRTVPREAFLDTPEDRLKKSGAILSATPEQVKAMQVQQEKVEANRKKHETEQSKREPHSHDTLSSEEHQRIHADTRALADEIDLFISDEEKSLEDRKSGRYKNMSIEDMEKRMQNIELRLNRLKRLRNSHK